MKKNFLTLMLFFAFLVVGIQNVSAQYVSEAEALVIVQTEIHTLETNNANTQVKVAADDLRLGFLKAINIHLLDGQTVPDAIIHGVHDAEVADYVVEPTTDSGDVYRTPLHQEIVDLLSL